MGKIFPVLNSIFKKIKIYFRFISLISYGKNHNILNKSFFFLFKFAYFMEKLLNKLKPENKNFSIYFKKVAFVFDSIKIFFYLNSENSNLIFQKNFVDKNKKNFESEEKKIKKKKNLKKTLFIINQEIERSIKSKQKLLYATCSLEKIEKYNNELNKSINQTKIFKKNKNLSCSQIINVIISFIECFFLIIFILKRF
jgi:hypothetical protein